MYKPKKKLTLQSDCKILYINFFGQRHYVHINFAVVCNNWLILILQKIKIMKSLRLIQIIERMSRNVDHVQYVGYVIFKYILISFKWI